MSNAIDLAEYVPMLRRLASKVQRQRYPKLDLDDLVSWGFFGLSAAAKRFDPARGKPFAVFAYRRVLGAMLDGAEAYTCWWGERRPCRIPGPMIDRACDKTSADADAEADDLWAGLTRGLNRRDRLVAVLFFRESLTVDEVAAAIGANHYETSYIIRKRIRPLFMERLTDGTQPQDKQASGPRRPR